MVVLHTGDEGDNVLDLITVHHLLQEGAEWSASLAHHVLHLVSQLSVHVLLQDVDVDGATLVGDDVLAVVSLIQDELKLLKVVTGDELIVLLLPKESLGEGADNGFWEPIVDVLVRHFHAKHFCLLFVIIT